MLLDKVTNFIKQHFNFSNIHQNKHGGRIEEKQRLTLIAGNAVQLFRINFI